MGAVRNSGVGALLLALTSIGSPRVNSSASEPVAPAESRDSCIEELKFEQVVTTATEEILRQLESGPIPVVELENLMLEFLSGKVSDAHRQSYAVHLVGLKLKEHGLRQIVDFTEKYAALPETPIDQDLKDRIAAREKLLTEIKGDFALAETLSEGMRDRKLSLEERQQYIVAALREKKIVPETEASTEAVLIDADAGKQSSKLPCSVDYHWESYKEVTSSQQEVFKRLEQKITFPIDILAFALSLANETRETDSAVVVYDTLKSQPKLDDRWKDAALKYFNLAEVVLPAGRVYAKKDQPFNPELLKQARLALSMCDQAEKLLQDRFGDRPCFAGDVNIAVEEVVYKFVQQSVRQDYDHAGSLSLEFTSYLVEKLVQTGKVVKFAEHGLALFKYEPDSIIDHAFAVLVDPKKLPVQPSALHAQAFEQLASRLRTLCSDVEKFLQESPTCEGLEDHIRELVENQWFTSPLDSYQSKRFAHAYFLRKVAEVLEIRIEQGLLNEYHVPKQASLSREGALRDVQARNNREELLEAHLLQIVGENAISEADFKELAELFRLMSAQGVTARERIALAMAISAVKNRLEKEQKISATESEADFQINPYFQKTIKKLEELKQQLPLLEPDLNSAKAEVLKECLAQAKGQDALAVLAAMRTFDSEREKPAEVNKINPTVEVGGIEVVIGDLIIIESGVSRIKVGRYYGADFEGATKFSVSEQPLNERQLALQKLRVRLDKIKEAVRETLRAGALSYEDFTDLLIALGAQQQVIESRDPAESSTRNYVVSMLRFCGVMFDPGVSTLLVSTEETKFTEAQEKDRAELRKHRDSAVTFLKETFASWPEVSISTLFEVLTAKYLKDYNRDDARKLADNVLTSCNRDWPALLPGVRVSGFSGFYGEAQGCSVR